MGTKHSRTLTLQQLKDKGACTEQTRLFQELFGTEVNVTVQAALVVYDKFDWSWAVQNLLSAAAFVEYDKACTAAFVEYDKALAAARGEYIKARDAARDEYYKVCAAARDEYYKVCAAARDEYYKVCAAAFATAYINDNE